MAEHIDPDFARRVADYQRKAKKGYAFQAEGTLGGKRARPTKSAWRLRPIYSLFQLIIFLIIIKACIYHSVASFDLMPETPVTIQEATLFQKGKMLLLYPDPFSENFSWFVTLLQIQVGQELRSFLSLDIHEVVESK